MTGANLSQKNHILHKDNVKELNKFVGSDLYGYKITGDMQSVEFSLKSNKKALQPRCKMVNYLLMKATKQRLMHYEQIQNDPPIYP